MSQVRSKGQTSFVISKESVTLIPHAYFEDCFVFIKHEDKASSNLRYLFECMKPAIQLKTILIN
jgi:hypothetical protein